MTRGCTVFDEQIAAHYEAWYRTAEGQRADAQEKASLKRLLGHFDNAQSILEVGCGTGHFAGWFEEQGLKAVGLDLSSPMLCQARAQLALSGTPWVQADGYRLPFADSSVDLVAYITTIEFLDTPQEALAEAVRVASRGLVLGVLNRWSTLALQRRLAGLFRPNVYETACFYGVGELKRLLRSLVNGSLAREMERRGRRSERRRIFWHTTLFPRWQPWQRAKLPWGGFIAMALSLPQAR